ncbi:hypothetical protein SEA_REDWATTLEHOG_138 [Gordonia phage RedWattleHog]|uniref:Uncharacterized protein n=1 Tax=Gordonia phage Stormageddon TaxID=2656541 RepID=A0A649VR99_9CAUD|nr:hypothetical protein KHQ86_gp164 [Gordonia phage Stormageddon]QGJ94996.1 hypothetical protein SEA_STORMAGEDDON_136 [Gordonia phage Stormageddon]QLF83641.1 hypothetical protein SEA_REDWATTLEHOG_138 [Gordonia phage RedWattleHog]
MVELTRAHDLSARDGVDAAVADAISMLRDAKKAMRSRTLAELMRLEESSAEFGTFSVVRTADRKGYRDPRSFNDERSPYQDDQKVLITIEIEVEDWDLTDGFVTHAAELERTEEALQAQVEIAEAQRVIAEQQERIARLAKKVAPGP